MEPKPPMQGQPPAQGGGQDEGAGAGALVTSIHSNLTKLQDMLGKAGVPEEVVAKLQGVIAGFQDFIQGVGGGGGQEGPPQGPPPGRPGGGMGRATSMGGPGAIPKM